MGFFGDLFSGPNGPANSASGRQSSNPGVRKFESLCAQLGWGIDGRNGDNDLILHFRDSSQPDGIREVLITAGAGGDIAVLSCHSPVRFSPSNIPAQLATYLLTQNAKAFFHAWRVQEYANGTASFCTSCSALLNGMEAKHLKLICEGMVRNVNELDTKLRQMGAL